MNKRNCHFCSTLHEKKDTDTGFLFDNSTNFPNRILFFCGFISFITDYSNRKKQKNKSMKPSEWIENYRKEMGSEAPKKESDEIIFLAAPSSGNFVISHPPENVSVSEIEAIIAFLDMKFGDEKEVLESHVKKENNETIILETQKNNLIDTSLQPFIPSSWSIESHHPGGSFEWDASKVVLHLEEEQKGGTIIGTELRKRLEGLPVMNACLLDFLLANTGLIPEEWKDSAVFFWGTIYRGEAGGLYVRCLYWDCGCWRWSWYYDWLDNQWGDERPAALFASA